MNWNNVLKRVNEIVKKDKLSLPLQFLYAILILMSLGFLFCGGIYTVMAIVAIVILFTRVRNHAKNMKEARRYAAEQLLFPIMREHFQLLECDAGKEVPWYMIEESGLVDKAGGYSGYGYVRATYRGIPFLCGNFELRYKKRTSRDDEVDYEREEARKEGRYAYSRYLRYAYFDGMFARADLNHQLNGFLKIEEINANPNLFGHLIRGMEELARKSGGARVFDFSGANEEFHKHFRVSTTDEAFAQQVLSQSMMKGLLSARQYASGPITILFAEDNMFITHRHGHALFCIENGKYEMQHLQEDVRCAENEVLTLRAILDTFADCAAFVSADIA